MASVVTRRHKSGECTFKVQWLLGGRRGAPWQSETFQDRRAALKFQSLVDASGQRWPEGWVKGVGFATLDDEVEEHPLLEFGTAYVRRLTSTGPDTQTRYVKQLTSLVAWLRTIKGVEPTVENVTGDDDRDWIVSRRKAGMSPKTIANYHGLLSALFKSAITKGLITRNPCEGVKLPPLDDDTEADDDMVFLTEAEFRMLTTPSTRKIVTSCWLPWARACGGVSSPRSRSRTWILIHLYRRCQCGGRGSGMARASLPWSSTAGSTWASRRPESLADGSRWRPSSSPHFSERAKDVPARTSSSVLLGAAAWIRATGTRAGGSVRSRQRRRRA